MNTAVTAGASVFCGKAINATKSLRMFTVELAGTNKVKMLKKLPNMIVRSCLTAENNADNVAFSRLLIPPRKLLSKGLEHVDVGGDWLGGDWLGGD